MRRAIKRKEFAGFKVYWKRTNSSNNWGGKENKMIMKGISIKQRTIFVTRN